jgi:hypothetical protein
MLDLLLQFFPPTELEATDRSACTSWLSSPGPAMDEREEKGKDLTISPPFSGFLDSFFFAGAFFGGIFFEKNDCGRYAPTLHSRW